jgi:hypothetical protein
MIQALPPQQNGKRTKPQPWEFRQYAEDLYHLFSQAWCCDCRNQHHLKLRLKSCPSADLRFRVLFCFDKTQSRPTRPWNYQQVVFHMTEAEYESEPSAKVRFKGLTPQHLPHVEGSKITDFCGRLKKGRPKSDCIGFLQEGQKRYYVYQDPEGTAYLPMKAYPDEYSLATALTTGISEQFEMVDRWLLALDLVSSISQLCSTSWLNEEWSKDNIVYFNKGQNVGTLVWEEPYLSLNLPVQKKTPLIQESLSTGERMAIILLEICFNQPLEESKTYKEYLKCIGNNAKLHRLAAMMRLFEVSNETAKEVVDAIRWCLTKKTSIFSKRKEIWIQEFYKKVVEPLQSCCENLSNTYSTESMKVERQDRSINCELSRSSVLSHSPAKGRQSQIEDPNAQHHRHNLHITETDEDSYRGDTFTSEFRISFIISF